MRCGEAGVVGGFRWRRQGEHRPSPHPSRWLLLRTGGPEGGRSAVGTSYKVKLWWEEEDGGGPAQVSCCSLPVPPVERQRCVSR